MADDLYKGAAPEVDGLRADDLEHAPRVAPSPRPGPSEIDSLLDSLLRSLARQVAATYIHHDPKEPTP